MKINWAKVKDQVSLLDDEAGGGPEPSAPWLLVVDDEEENRALFSTVLGKNYNIVTAETGEDALNKISQQDFAVVLSDHRMPVMTGIELCAELEKRNHSARRIIVTGYAELHSVIKAINQAGIYRYLTKPVAQEEMKSVIADAVTQYQMQQENRRLLSVVKDILEENSELQKDVKLLGGDERKSSRVDAFVEPKRVELAVMFIDVRGFTKLSSSTTASEVIGLLRDLFAPMHEAIYDAGGIVDKHLGDGLMAVFGLGGGESAGPALGAAQQVVDTFARDIATIRGGRYKELKLSIGLSKGEVVLGMLGSERRSELAVIGQPANFAARLQEFTKLALARSDTPLGDFPHAMALCQASMLPDSSSFADVTLAQQRIRDFADVETLGLYRA